MGNKYFVRMLVVALALCGASSAQVLSLGKVNDPVSKRLQKQYFAQLQQIATQTTTIHFPYPFYFSQALDIDEARQKQLPQGSIRFDQFNGQTVLAISGNYYISYSSTQLNGNQRARKAGTVRSATTRRRRASRGGGSPEGGPSRVPAPSNASTMTSADARSVV